MDDSISRHTNICGIRTRDDVRKFYVIAGTYQIYVEWCHLHGFRPTDGHKVWFTVQPMQLRGINDSVLVLTNLHHEQKHHLALRDIAITNGMEIIDDNY